MNRHALLIIALLWGMIAALSLPLTLPAQTPQAIAYQAIVRDADGNPLANQAVSLQITLHQGSEAGYEVYSEIHSVTTNPLGLVNLEIGQGTGGFGTFSDIPWKSGAYFMEVELDPAGGTAYVPMGTTQLVSIPYALYSDDVARIQGSPVSPAAPAQDQVLQWNGAQWEPSTISGGSPGWSLTGNSGTDPVINFLGTTDNQPLIFRVNNLPAGQINPVNDNTFLGLHAGNDLASTANYTTAIGGDALHSNTTGWGNTALGCYAHFFNTTGTRNTALGLQALYYNTVGEFNTATGSGALFYNTTGSTNTASGRWSMVSNTTGHSNVAIGAMALYSNTVRSNLVAVGDSALYNNGLIAYQSLHAVHNTAIGSKALYSNTSGFRNTATGYQAIYSNTTGYENTSNGSQSLFYNTTGRDNTAMGFAALLNNTTGSSNVAIGIRTLQSGTIQSNMVAIGDSALLNNGIGAGSFSYHATMNTAIGSKALYSNTTGYDNTATGFNALCSNTNGYGNSAIGSLSLFSNTTGNDNTANGYRSLYSNTTGEDNTSGGSLSLHSNTTGSYNTAFGTYALYENTAGDGNTSYGWSALRFNTLGLYNTASGYCALQSNTSSENTASGSYALFSNTVGLNNTAVGCFAGKSNVSGCANTCTGYYALYDNTSGNHNTAFGGYAGTVNVSGDENTCIGYGANLSNSQLNNTTVVGYDATVNTSNKVRIGNGDVTVIEGQVNWSFPSDGRFKSNVRDEVKGLDFIMKLNPVVYNFDTRKYTEFLTRNMPESLRRTYLDHKDFSASTAIRHSGFVAQEVAVAASEVGYDFDGVHIPATADDNYSISPGQFVPALVKAIQEQQAMIEEQKAMIEELQKMNIEMQQRVTTLEAAVGRE